MITLHNVDPDELTSAYEFVNNLEHKCAHPGKRSVDDEAILLRWFPFPIVSVPYFDLFLSLFSHFFRLIIF